MSRIDTPSARWGLVAELASADALVDAARRARESGFARAEAYSPFPVDGLAEALAFEPSRVAPITLAGAVIGGVGAYLLQWYTATIDYPINVAGRPLHSWPMFVPSTFEMTGLGGAIAAVLAWIVGSRLPRLHHPLFAVPEFDLATRNRFFLALGRDDPSYDEARARDFLVALEPLGVFEVPL